MNRKNLLEMLNSSRFTQTLEALYAPCTVESEGRRYAALAEGMSGEAGFPRDSLDGENFRVFSAPGRTELARTVEILPDKVNGWR